MWHEAQSPVSGMRPFACFRSVTGLARRAEMSGLFFGRDAAVRIMAGQAGELAAARQETFALTQSIGVMIDLEAVGREPAVLIDVDPDEIIRQRLARPERKIGASEPAQPRHGHRRLEMAAHADLVPLPGVENARADLLAHADPAHREPDVVRSRAMAALAADPFRQVRREERRRAVGIGAHGHVRIGNVTEEAFAAHPAEHAVVIRTVEPRRHPPAQRLAVPGERKLIDLARRCPIEVRPRMIAGAENPVHRRLEDIDGPPLCIVLPAPENQSVAVAPDLQNLARSRVDERRSGEVLDVLLPPRAGERPGHPFFAVGRGDRRMAGDARGVVHEPRRGAGAHPNPELRELAGHHLPRQRGRGRRQKQKAAEGHRARKPAGHAGGSIAQRRYDPAHDDAQ
jgi:hypothetical protein